jgi:hypothetical protein
MYNNFNHPQQQGKKLNPISGDSYPPQHAPPPPPPYSASDTASQPSAPPLMEQDSNPYTSYNPNPYPKDNNVYPPRGYLYGSVPQQQQGSQYPPPPPPPPVNPAGSNWPWFTPQPPMLPVDPIAPNKMAKLGGFFGYCLIIGFFFIIISGFFKIVVEGGGNISCSINGAVWPRLPDEIIFEGNLRVSTTGDGHFSSGNIKLVETNDEYPQGTILSTIRASPKSVLDDLDYTLTTDKNNETHLEFNLPIKRNWRQCIHLEMTIYVPRHLNKLNLSVQNTAIKSENERLLIDALDVTTSNAMIGIGSEWQGESLALTTSNGRILLDGPALGKTGVTLKSSNGRIDTKKVTTKEMIQLTTSNAAIHTQDLDAPLIKLRTTNGHVVLDHIHAVNADIVSSNAKVEVSSSIIEESIVAKTSNAAIFVRVDEGKHIIADVRTSNGPPTLYMVK